MTEGPGGGAMDVVIALVDPTVDDDWVVDVDGDRVQWDAVVDLADAHGVLPIVAERLRELDPPPDIVEGAEYRDRRSRRAATGLHHVRALGDVTDRLADADVRFLWFKGPVLALELFDDPTARQYGDLDLLVHPEDIDRAHRHLVAAGFEPPPSMPPPSDALFGGLVRPPLLTEYLYTRDGINLEMRWRIGATSRPFGLDFATAWQRRSSTSVDNVSVNTLDPIDRVQVLAYHGTKHCWSQLKWVLDFAAALQPVRHRWDTVIDRAHTYDNTRRLALGLALVEALWSVDVDGELPDRSTHVDRLATATIERLRSGSPDSPGSVGHLRYNLRAADRHRDRLRMILGHRPLHPSAPEYQTLALPRHLWGVYYLLRPVRLAGQGVTGRTGTH